MKVPAVKVPDIDLPGPLPSTGTLALGARVVVAAAIPVVRHGDLRAIRHLPFVLTHLDDAAVVAGAISDPVGSAIKAPGAAVRLGARGAIGGARLGVRGVTAPVRLVTGKR